MKTQSDGLKDQKSIDRRKAMAKAGKYAAFSAASMIALLYPLQSLADSTQELKMAADPLATPDQAAEEF